MPLWSVALPRPPAPRPHVLRAVAPIVAAMRARPTHAGPIVSEGLRAARSLGSWSLVTCCVGPGFDFADFELLRDRAEGAKLPGADPALR